MQFDLSLTIMGVIALSAIVSPVIVTLITNIFDIKKMKIKLFKEEKQKLLNEYLEYLSTFVNVKTSAFDVREHEALLIKLSAYISPKTVDFIRKKIQEHPVNQNALFEIASALAQECKKK